MAIYSYQIGTTTTTMTNIEDLFGLTLPPKSSFTPASQYLTLGNGQVRAGGWATAEWHWNATSDDFLPRTQRDQLRTYCPAPAASTTVFIRTRCNESTDSYKTYQAIMVWPQEEVKEFDVRKEFSLKFQHLIEVST